MRDISAANFGLVIAYLLPGFIVLWGISYLSPTVAIWFGQSAADSPTVAGFLFVTLASIASGMTVNAFRWLTIDNIHHRTGISYPKWDFAKLQSNLGAYERLVEFYYRYHEFFGNALVASTFTYIVWRWHHPGWHLVVADFGYVGLMVLFWLASRDTLKKYYARSQRLLPSCIKPPPPRSPRPGS